MPLSCKYIPQPILWKNPPHTGFFPETVRGPAHVKSSPDASGINRCSYLPFPAQTIIQIEVPAPSTFFASSPIPLSISYSDRDPPHSKTPVQNPRTGVCHPHFAIFSPIKHSRKFHDFSPFSGPKPPHIVVLCTFSSKYHKCHPYHRLHLVNRLPNIIPHILIPKFNPLRRPIRILPRQL